MKIPPFVEVTVGDVKVELASDDRICGHILSGKKFEPETLRYFGELVEKGMHVLDIGCYSGLFAIAAVKLGAIVTAFEPYPPNIEQVQKNAVHNGADFLLYTSALSEKSGTAAFGHNKKVHLTSGGSLERKSGDKIPVPTLRLDDLAPEMVKVDVIKMDVERHEPAVIRGARYLLRRDKPVLIVECNDEEMLRKVTQELSEVGYALARQLDVRNYVFTPPR